MDKNQSDSIQAGVDKIVDGYDVLMEQLHAWVEKADETAGPMLVNGLHDAEVFLHDLGKWSEEEIDVISRYVKRDIHDVSVRLDKTNQSFIQWLELDSNKVEAGVLDILETMTDKTRQELDKLSHLAEEPHVWHTGEVTGVGTLVCKSCGKQLHYQKSGRIPPCPTCSHTEFDRAD